MRRRTTGTRTTHLTQRPEPSGASEASEPISGDADRKKIVDRIRKYIEIGGDLQTPADDADEYLMRAHVLLPKLYKPDVRPENTDTNWTDVQDAPAEWPEWPEAVDGYELVGDLLSLLNRYLVMQPKQRMTVALWILHAHAHAVAENSPLLVITGPTIGVGKTRLFKCLVYLVPRPWSTNNATAAAIFGEIEDNYSTILIDDADTFINEPRHTEIRSVLDSGFNRGGYVRRRAGRASTWAPKVIALTGHLHPSLESRSIIIRMERKLTEEKTKRLRTPRQGDINNEFVVLRRKAARWAKDHMAELRNTDPELPSELDDRTADAWRPLIAIADACDRSTKSREAAVAITGQKLKERPIGEQLLEDMQWVFHRLGSPLSSKEIVAELLHMEARPWITVTRGGPLTTAMLALLLRPFLIAPGEIKTVSGRRANGYRIEQFADVFKRYARK